MCCVVMKRRSKSLIPFQVVSCVFAFACLVSASAQSSPTPRTAHSAAWDAARGELVVFVGVDSGNRVDDTWVWNGTNWFNRSPVPSPSPRAIRQGMAYDKQRQEVILFGGDFGGGSTNDTWAWTGTNWNVRIPTNAPA